MENETTLRELLARLLAWEDAHVGFDAAIAEVPENLRGRQPEGLPYSLWQLLEHLRRTQRDILEFCRNPKYRELKWPDDYWPEAAAPPSAAGWNASVAQFIADRRELVRLAEDPAFDIFARIPHGSGQTYIRELVLAADHAAYHVGQLVLVRRLLGIWKS